jgi:hypothetical protein
MKRIAKNNNHTENNTQNQGHQSKGQKWIFINKFNRGSLTFFEIKSLSVPIPPQLKRPGSQ